MLATLLATACFAAPDTRTITFEDVYGPCGPFSLVAGPGDPVFDGVQFETPDVATWNCGEESSAPPGLGNPFDSDALLFFAFGPGATIVFPQPIVNLSFTAGQRTNMQTFPSFELRADETPVAVFTASLFEATTINLSFDVPVSSVRFVFLAGSSSMLGIDDLSFAFASLECPGDLDGDGAVNPPDIAFLLGAWGPVGSEPAADLDGDGVVGPADLALVLAAWGTCPS
jgi:hypothetical protein